MKTAYDFTVDDEEYPDEAYSFETIWGTDYLKYAAEDAADFYYTKHAAEDPKLFPLVINLYGKGILLGSFEVIVEFEPVFSAGEKK